MVDMRNWTPVPNGIEDFQELRRNGYYYVDKTALLTKLLRQPAKVTLFTRPRRFGKTLMLDTIRSFFEVGAQPSDFAGLAIAREAELCRKHMGQYPVISISLKGMEGPDYSSAIFQLKRIVFREIYRIGRHLDRSRLDQTQNSILDLLLDRNMPDLELQESLRDMSALLHSYYGVPAVILIDEYDVPFDKAFHAARPYYREMATFLRSFLGNALKTNPDLYFAVLTGCLRIARESIFTGLNNFRIMSISCRDFEDSFGFTEAEVQELLTDYGLEAYDSEVRDWYDGYLFGGQRLFCPWDVLNYIASAQTHPGNALRNYWINSSGNEIVRRLIRGAGPAERKNLEQLLAGKPIYKTLREELTYGEIYDSVENIWSVMYATGYLTRSGPAREDGTIPLILPNREVRQIFEEQIWEWFRAETRQNPEQLSALCQALADGDAETVEPLFTTYLQKMISIRDTAVRRAYQESFYHGLLLGLLSAGRAWVVRSNPESGLGYADILIEDEDTGTGIILELKYAHDGNLDNAAETALAQIKEKNYDSSLRAEGYRKIRYCGIGCWKKLCRVQMEQAAIL